MSKKSEKISYKMKKLGIFTFTLIFLSILLIFALIYPIFEAIYTQTTTDYWGLVEAFQSPMVLEAILNSFLCSMFSTLIALLLGIPLAYLLANYEFRGKNVIDSLIDLPLLIPHSVAGIMLFFVFTERGLLGQFFSIFGITFFNTYWGVTIAMFFVSSPILIKGMRDAFLKINPTYIKAARTLGASQHRTFFDITLSLSSYDMVSNSLLCWARGISEFGAVYVLASFPLTGATYVHYLYEGSGIDASRPVAICLVIISILLFITLRVIDQQLRGRRKNI